jgi:hypothetical protein
VICGLRALAVNFGHNYRKRSCLHRHILRLPVARTASAYLAKFPLRMYCEFYQKQRQSGSIIFSEEETL